jgi:uncharacterized protein (TIGR00106 family)
MLASFSVIPIGVGIELKEHVSSILELVEESGLSFQLGAMQTTLEGEASEVMDLIMRCHLRMRERAPRVLTHITIDDREGAEGRLKGKVQDVIDTLGRDLNHE